MTLEKDLVVYLTTTDIFEFGKHDTQEPAAYFRDRDNWRLKVETHKRILAKR